MLNSLSITNFQRWFSKIRSIDIQLIKINFYRVIGIEKFLYYVLYP